MNNKRSVFGWIFLAVGLGIFYVLASSSIATELNDVLHGPPLTEPVRQAMPGGLNKAIDAVLPAKVENLPHIKYVNKASKSTNDDPFQQFNVVIWLGWSFVIAALAEVGRAYLVTPKTRVEE